MTTPPDPRLPLPEFVRRARSIARELTLLFVGTTMLLLLFAAGYLYWSLSESLTHQDQAFVMGKFQVLSVLLREHPEKTEALASEIEHESAANEVLKYYLRVLDDRGRLLLETTDMSSFLPVLAFPAPVPPGAVPPILERQLGAAHNYLLLAAEVEAGGEGRPRRILQIALDVEHNNEVLADYRWKLLIVLGSGLVFAATAGGYITRTGLRPLRSMAHATQRITASQLSARLRAEDWPAELRELAAAFNAMLDGLQDSFGRLNDFSSDIAHALRNPINNLRGEAEVALTAERRPGDYQQTLASSLEEYERLSRMIDGLLFIARTDNPAVVTEKQPFNARREITAVQEFYEALATDKRLAVTVTGEANLRGDSMLFRRAVSNLLANAIKHTPAGGAITLNARNLPNGSAEIAVADNGPGIAAEHLPRIFERFFQINKSRDQTSEGAGLGLAIVRSIMRLHRGTAEVHSTVGRGTTFTLRFPAG